MTGIRVVRIIVLGFVFFQIVLISQPSFSTEATPTIGFCVVCVGNESLAEWLPQYPSVNVTLNNQDKQEGLVALKVTIRNETRAVGTAYGLGSTLDLRSGGILVLWVKVETLGMVRSLYLSIGDSNGNWRQFYDFGRWFALEPERWTRVAIDISHFVSEAQGFDIGSVQQLWFGSFGGGSSYNQNFSLDDIRLSDFPSQSSGSSAQSTDLLPLWLATITILFLYIVTLPVGVLAWKALGSPFSKISGPISSLPLKLSLGISVEAVIFLIASLVFINRFIVWGVWALAPLITLFVWRRSLHLPNFPRMNRQSLFTNKSAGSLGTIISIGFSVYVMARAASVLGWAPPNDSFIHAIIVSLILFNGHLGSTFYPISSIPLDVWGYSRGFYGLPTALSFSSGTYPGQSIMLVGAAIAALLPALLYSVTLIRTRSPLWATLSFLSAFILPGLVVVDAWVPSNDLLFGAFLVATYPSLMGNFLLLTMFAVVVLMDDFGPVSLRLSKWLWGFLLLTCCMSVTYYPYLVFPLTYLLIRIMTPSRWHSLALRVGRVRLGLLVGIATIVVSYAFFEARTYAITTLSLDTQVQYQIAQTVNPLSIGHPYILYAIMVGTTIALGLFSRLGGLATGSKMRAVELFFGVTLAIHVISLSNETAHGLVLWMTNPSRSLIVLYSLTYVMIPLYLWNLSPAILGRIRRARPDWKLPSWRLAWKLWILLLMFLAFSPMISAAMNYAPSTSRPDILEVPHDGDYLVSQWAASNIESHQLILNDLSLSGLSLTSFRAIHVVNDMQRLEELYIFHTLPDSERTYILDADRILQHPGDYQMVLGTMRKYNITYIYVSDASRTIGLFGSGVRFAPAIDWTMTQVELLAVYHDNPYLQLAYQSGSAAIFELRFGPA